MFQWRIGLRLKRYWFEEVRRFRKFSEPLSRDSLAVFFEQHANIFNSSEKDNDQ